ncbi:MAG: TonB family protein [Alphaproteobacteria bacterium]|nr:TonB family protein [Alphaproteobacteria bacterium]
MRPGVALTVACLLLPVTRASAQEGPADEAPDTAEPLPIVRMPSILAYVEAPYPPDAEAQGLEATVRVLLDLDETGAVTYAEVLEPAGHGFDEAALRAVRQMRFTPAETVEGPVAVSFPFDYRFELDTPPAAPKPQGPEPKGGVPDPEEPLPIVQMPEITTYVEAPYPPDAEAGGIEGTVVLLVTLDEEGVVEDVAIKAPAGHGFDEAALDAVRAMTFSPARTEEGPVGVVFEFAYAFSLAPEEPEPDPDTIVNVEGRVRQMGTRDDVAEATIYLPEIDRSTLTDAEGRFALEGVPAGIYTLLVRHPEHLDLEQPIEVVDGQVTSATLWIRSITYRENEAVGYYERERTEVTRRTLSIEEVKRIPGTFGDPVKVIQTLPGAARSPFGTGLLIIRGADPADSAVYVDGVRIPIIYHLTGTTSVLSPDAIQQVDFLPGGYGVQYGRTLAGTIDVKTKEWFPERKLKGGFDILDAQVWFEGPVDKKEQHGLALGARRSYIDLIIPAFTGDTGFNISPVYWDYQLKYVPRVWDDQDLSVFVYGFQDTLTVSTPDDFAQSADPSTQGDLSTTYQSHRLLLRYQKRWGENVNFDFRPSVGYDSVGLGLGQDFGLDQYSVQFQLRSELAIRPHPVVEVIPGIDLQGGPYGFEFKSPFSFADLDDPLAERDPIGFDGRGSRWSTAPYLKVNLRPLKDRDRWLLTAGLRYDATVYFVEGGITFDAEVEPTVVTSVDPRVATRLVVFEKGDHSGTFKASTGLYHQPPQFFQSIGIGATARLLAERAWNSSVGFEHRINQAFSWDLDVFYRSVDQVVTFNNGGFVGRGSQPFANEGEGYAYGFEVLLRHAPVNRFFGYISYTFSRSFRRNSPDQDFVPFDYDQPHIFSAQGGYTFPGDIGLSGQIQIVSGNPFTPRNAGVYDVDSDSYSTFATGPRNSERLPVFVQTSIRLDKTWTFKRWQLETYLELLNALRGVNPEATIYNYDGTEFGFVRGLPFIPNIGLEFTFYP